ncbi:MAG: TetR/AcrR family transcriptional regulator [bacterium]|nr:TetR/AcrR family transcriptional regulator [bacterium]
MSQKRYKGKLKQIEDAALEVFIEQGIENLTLEAVTEKLGYTKQAIYYYFPNKEELVSSFCLNILQSARDEFLEIFSNGKNPDETLKDIISYYVKGTCLKKGFFALHHDLKQIMAHINNNEIVKKMLAMMGEITDGFISVISKGIEKGVFKKEEPDIVANTIFALLGGVVSMNEIYTLKKLSVQRKVELITDIILKGIKV